MVAKINTGKSISKALNYNEQKVQTGMAEILLASGFIKDMEYLNFNDKLNQFQRHISLNERTATNTLHVSLNFDVSEKISNEKMTEIAQVYMEKIGFSDQPYLVYRHKDAGHPHLHIVSTNIKKDGTRKSLHNLGRLQSEQARKEIEINFGLVIAGNKPQIESKKITPVNAQKINYGKAELKRSISNVLVAVIDQYKYTSLPELNAVLRLYNVNAERGSEESRMFQHKGLTYHAIDDAGKKVGTPIKASAFYMKPTLANLENKFIENQALKEQHSKRLKVSIDWILNKAQVDLPTFVRALEKEHINVVLRKGKDGIVFGITYVDHKTKCVFNGSDLGKAYSAKAIMKKCNPILSEQPAIFVAEKIKETTQINHPSIKPKESVSTCRQNNFHPGLPLTVPSPGYIPSEFKKKKKRIKKISI